MLLQVSHSEVHPSPGSGLSGTLADPKKRPLKGFLGLWVLVASLEDGNPQLT